MNSKVENPKTEVPETSNLNDRDYLNGILESLKNMSNNFSIALNECSNETMYKEVFTMFQETKDMAREAYTLMFQNGWYSLEKAEQQKIMSKQNDCSLKMKQLS